MHLAQDTLTQTGISILNQTLTDFEWLIVVDDGAINYYSQLPELQDKRIRWFSTPYPASGASVARNIGLKNARGEFISHLDSDDLMFPNRLQALLPLVRKHNVATDLHEIVDSKTNQALSTSFTFSKTWATPQDVSKFNLPFCPVYRSSMNIFWNDKVRFSEDVLFNMEMVIMNDGMAVMPISMMQIVVRPNSVSNKMPEAYFRAKDGYDVILDILVSSKHWRQWPEVSDFLKNIFLRKKLLNEEFWLGYKAGQYNNFSEFAAMQNEACV